MLLLREQILKKLKKENNQKKKEKIIQFAYEILSRKEELRNSLYILKMKGTKTEIYKFRLNSGDRVLFTFGDKANIKREEYGNSIILLDYCKHDDQDRIARNMNEDYNVIPFEKEEEIDYKFEEKYRDYEFDIENDITVEIEDELYKQLLKKGDIAYLYYLNSEQYECVKSKYLTIVTGSAGSGKTTVLIRKLLTFKDLDKKLAYFTYTRALKNHAETLFNTYCKPEYKKKVKFFSITDFYLQNIDITADNMITYNKFKKWFEENKYKFTKNNYHPIDVWAEIRGLIKGTMGINWIRHNKFNKSEFKEDVINILEEFGWIEVYGNYFSFKNYTLYEIKKTLLSNGYKNEQIIKEIEYLFYKIYKDIDIKELIEEEVYFSLPQDYSIFELDEKRELYNITKAYQEWLKENKLYDENDLARICISLIKDNKIEKYDYIVIDEIQDLTDLQVYMLFNLVKDKNRMFMGGDVHQIINSTFFEFGRIENYLTVMNLTEYVKKSLQKNYRSQGKIIDLANYMAELRREYIGALGDDIKEKSIRDGYKPILLKNSEDTMRKIIDYVIENQAFIIVADEISKDNLINKYKNLSEYVLLVHEAKGLEFKCVICYNILSPNKEYWQDILRGKGKRNSKYRYFFNLFYVAITRARELLIMLEDDTNLDIVNQIKDYIEIKEDIDFNEIEIDFYLDEDEKYQEAWILEQNERYDQAIMIYKKLDKHKEVKRCEIKKLVDKKGYEWVGDKLLEMEEYEEANVFYEYAKRYDKKLKTMILSGLYTIEEIREEMQDFSVPIKDVLKILKENEWEGFVENYFNKEYNNLSEFIENINLFLLSKSDTVR